MLEIYKGKRVLVTGHAGFKGSWLCQWLKQLGAHVIGYGHPPNTIPSHHRLLGYKGEGGMELTKIGFAQDCMKMDQPDLVIHLAAKAIVAKTFEDPRGTFENNVMGAVNILEACRQCPSIKGIVMITTDKVYEDQNWSWGYREKDDLGGTDPYSASKVCIEQVIKCYRESFGLNISVARAGNVIGGGDWSYARLIPDMVRAAAKGEKVKIHTLNATRPFQHVLDALHGYLLLGEIILRESLEPINHAWNFGPSESMRVMDVLQCAHHIWDKIQWEVDNTPTHPNMVYLLKLDSSESKRYLGWEPKWSIEEAIHRTIHWYKEYYEKGEIWTDRNIAAFAGKS